MQTPLTSPSFAAIRNSWTTRKIAFTGETSGGALETALVITPIEEEGKTVVFYLWGVQPKWDINYPGCTRALGTEDGKKLTVHLRENTRVIYKFSGDKASVKFKRSGRATPGKVTLSDS